MVNKIQLTDLFLGTVVLLICLHCDCRFNNSPPFTRGYGFINLTPLDSDASQVYTTESCPTSQTEWNERSSVFNCTQENAYMCLPNKNISELLEFCYSLPQTQIRKGYCLLLNKNHSIVELYDCSNFSKGCPNSNYKSQEAYQYQSCVSIANGCFLADPTCRGDLSPQGPIDKDVNVDLIIAVTSLFLILIAAVTLIICCCCYKGYRRRNNDQNEENISMFPLNPPLEKQSKSYKIEERNSKTNIALSSLIKACGNDDLAKVRSILEKGVSLNAYDTDGYSPLSKACQQGHDNIVEHLLNKDADVNLYNDKGTTPLWIACENGHDGTVHILLTNGADINKSDKKGDSPLYVACNNDRVSIAQSLLENGADINLGNTKGFSPLYIACHNGHQKIVSRLLENNANVNLTDENGTSPLWIACQNGHTETVRLLLNSGADINLCNDNRVRPVDIARQNQHYSTVTLLRRYDADIK